MKHLYLFCLLPALIAVLCGSIAIAAEQSPSVAPPMSGTGQQGIVLGQSAAQRASSSPVPAEAAVSAAPTGHPVAAPPAPITPLTMNKRLYVDFHILQTVPPSCINRDDTGSPKTAGRTSTVSGKPAANDAVRR